MPKKTYFFYSLRKNGLCKYVYNKNAFWSTSCITFSFFNVKYTKNNLENISSSCLVFYFCFWSLEMDIIGSLVYSFGWNLKKINMMSIEDKPEWAIILMCMVIKHCCRRLFGLLSSLHSKELSDRVMFLSEHVIFSFWAYHCVYYVPEMENPGSSW